MAYIYIDESGQFSRSSNGEYFVVASFIVNKQKNTIKEFIKWQKKKFPKRMRGQSEIKWTDVKITESLRKRTLQEIAKMGVRIHYVYLKRKNIPDLYRTKSRLESGLLYTHVISKVLDLYLPSEEKEFRVFCDKRQLKGVTHTKFQQVLIADILPKLPANAIVQVEMIDSTTNANIQIVDWIVGAITSYLEGKPEGEEYMVILKNNLLGNGFELFKDYDWQED